MLTSRRCRVNPATLGARLIEKRGKDVSMYFKEEVLFSPFGDRVMGVRLDVCCREVDVSQMQLSTVGASRFHLAKVAKQSVEELVVDNSMMPLRTHNSCLDAMKPIPPCLVNQPR